MPDIGPAGAGIERVVDRGGNIGAAVEPVLEMHGQRREVGRLAGLDHLLHRRLAARHLDDLRLGGEAALDLGGEPLRRDAEGAGDAGAARHHIADQFLALRTRGAEMHRARIAVEDLGDAGEIDRSIAALDFAAVRQVFDEAAQAEAIEIARRRRRGARCLVGLFDHAHLVHPRRRSRGGNVLQSRAG